MSTPMKLIEPDKVKVKALAESIRVRMPVDLKNRNVAKRIDKIIEDAAALIEAQIAAL